jgi:hypothetical protein
MWVVLFEIDQLTKAKLLLLKLIHFFAREVLLVKKMEIEETKTTYTANVSPIESAGNPCVAKCSL